MKDRPATLPLVTLVVMALLEGGLLLFLILLLAHDPVWRRGLLAAWVLLFGVVAVVVTRRLRTRPGLPVLREVPAASTSAFPSAASGGPSRAPSEVPSEVPATSFEVVPAASPIRPAGAGAGEPAIRIAGLARSFGPHRAVDGLDLEVRRGEVYGFLGPNGAGKTTTIRMLVGLIAPDEGEVWIDGHDLRAEPLAAKSAFGYVPDRALLYDRLTGRELLEFLAQLRGLPEAGAGSRIAELLDLLELAEAADRLCGSYSFGMKRKLALAGALLHRPAVLILDEPFNGLDPRSARRLKDLLGRLAAGGTGLLLSTHDLATAETVCHRVGILHRGRLVAEGRAEDLRGLTAGGAAPDLEAVFLELTAEAVGEEPAA